MPLFGADRVLIVADEFPAMEILARKLEAGAGVSATLVKQTEMPAELAPFKAVFVYIHRDILAGPEKAFIEYANNGGKLVLMHHSISSGKRKNQDWLPFLGVKLPEGDVQQGGYKYHEGIRLEMVNLAPAEFIATEHVKYPKRMQYKGAERDAIVFDDSEVYLNHVYTGTRTILFGLKFTDAKTGQSFLQDTAGWYRPAGSGWVFYFMPGHSTKEFENPAYSQILLNAYLFQPGAGVGR